MQVNDKAVFKENYHLYLRQQMLRQGLNGETLGKKAGISRQGINVILRNKGGRDGVVKVCKALGIDINEILKDKILGD